MSYSNISNNNNQHDHAGTVHRNYKHQPSTFSIVHPSSTNQYNAYYYKNNSNINYTIHVIHDDADSPTSSNNGGGANPLQPLEARLESLHLVMSTTPAIATTEITPASPSSPSTSDPFNANNPLAPPIGPATTKKATTTTTTTTPKSQFSNHLYFDFNSNNNNDKTLQHADNTAAAEIIGEEGEADDEDDIMYDASEYDDELGFLVQRFDLQEESAKRSAFMPYIC